MKIYLIAGETSGDIHGAEIVKHLKDKHPDSTIRAMGGPSMDAAGAEISFDYREYAIMGFIEVLRNLRSIKKHLSRVEADIISFSPDIVIMIDYPGFNLRIAKNIYQRFPLHYYIAPKAWAWKSKRSHKLAKYFISVNCILPFEIEFFKSYKVPAVYVGNPSKNQVNHYIDTHKVGEESAANEGKTIALFPGSRKQEIERILPVMLSAIRGLEHINYKISQAPGMDSSVYLPFIDSEETLYQDNYKLLEQADAALITSGTATLETALFNVPQVVCYITSPISYNIGKSLVKIKYISLVNLILDEPCVPELIQGDCNPKRIDQELRSVLSGTKRQQMLQSYKKLNVLLGDKNAAAQAVENILSTTS